MFVRKKKLRNKKTGKVYEYAYVVKNKWKKKGSCQKVKQYLGRVYQPLHINQLSFEQFINRDLADYLESTRRSSIIKDLLSWEMKKYGEGFTLDFSKKLLLKNNKPACLEINEGMLNSYTIKQLLTFKKTADQRETGRHLATVFVNAGIAIPKEVFVHLFDTLT